MLSDILSKLPKEEATYGRSFPFERKFCGNLQSACLALKGSMTLKGALDRRSIDGGRLCKGLVNRSRTRSLGQRSEDVGSVGAHCLRLRLKDRGWFRVSRGSGIDDRQRIASSSSPRSPLLLSGARRSFRSKEIRSFVSLLPSINILVWTGS